MPNIKELNNLIEDGQSLKLITQALGEISALRLNKIRDNTRRNRQFFDEIIQVYHMIKIIAAQKKILTKTNEKTVSVLLTSNIRFTGLAGSQLIRYFIKNTSRFETERVVIGKSGQQSLSSVANEIPFKVLIFKDDLPSYDELKQLTQLVYGYTKVLIYYTKFESMLSQQPAATDITASSQQTKITNKELSYIFEPEIEKVLNFFNTQVYILLLEQIFLEAELSRVAARLINMSEAEDKADTFLNEQKVKLGTAKKSINNIHLLENLISQIKFRERSLWLTKN